jgi:hypothetical protein
MQAIAIYCTYQFTELWSVKIRANSTLYESYRETAFQN